EGHFGDAAVFVGDRNVGFDDHPDNISAVGGLDDLLLDGEFEVVFRVFDTGGVDQPELANFVVSAGEAGLGHDAVAGGAGFAGDDGFAAFQDGVEQAGLANIGPADDCYDW